MKEFNSLTEINNEITRLKLIKSKMEIELGLEEFRKNVFPLKELELGKLVNIHDLNTHVRGIPTKVIYNRKAGQYEILFDDVMVVNDFMKPKSVTVYRNQTYRFEVDECDEFHHYYGIESDEEFDAHLKSSIDSILEFNKYLTNHEKDQSEVS